MQFTEKVRRAWRRFQQQMAFGKAHHQASKDEKDARREIKSDQQKGKPASNPSIEKKGEAITKQADLKEAQKRR